MNYYKKSLLCACMALATLTSCDNHDNIEVPDKNPDSDQGQKPTPVEPEELHLTLDLTASIKQADEKLKYTFAEEVSAVALIRNTENEGIIYLPVKMTRSEKGEQVEVTEVVVAMNGAKVDAQRKWQLKLIIGGEWDADNRQIRFNAPTDLTPSEQQTTLSLSQPYVSDWVALPTDEEGQFVSSSNGRTALSLEMNAPAHTLSHHISSCDAEADVEIERLKIESASLSFDGYFDVSDAKALKAMGNDAALTWNPLSKESNLTDITFATPVLLKKGEQPTTADYLYLWGMPTTSESQKMSVTASGKVLNKAGEKFSDIKIFDADLSTEQGRTTEILSKVYIEYTPEVSGPITLSTVSDKTTIIADDVDEVEFVVMQGGVNVTSQCTIYHRVNDIITKKLPGHTFKTDKKGSYEFYAVKENEQSKSIRITAQPKTETGPDGHLVNGTKFAKNVSLQSGWYDVNKIGNGTSPVDGLLCWAAASSNLLQWWLDDFIKQGHELPESVPYGPGSRYRLAIFDTYFDCWTNYMHSTEPAVRWFMEGGGMQHASQNTFPNKGGVVHEGGYFKGVLSPEKEQELFASDYIREISAYSGWIVPSREGKGNMHKIFSDLFMTFIDEGVTGLSVDSHELTAWGYDVENGLITRIYVTNSDDGGNARLASYKVEMKSGDIHLSDYPGKTYQPTQIIRLTRLKAYNF